MAPVTVGMQQLSSRVPRPRTASQLVSPPAASRPKAEPPLSTSPCSVLTMLDGSNVAVLTVNGEPPRTSTAASTGRSASTTVTPLHALASWALPTARPAISVRLLRGPGMVMALPSVTASAGGAVACNGYNASGTENASTALRNRRRRIGPLGCGRRLGPAPRFGQRRIERRQHEQRQQRAERHAADDHPADLLTALGAGTLSPMPAAPRPAPWRAVVIRIGRRRSTAASITASQLRAGPRPEAGWRTRRSGCRAW